MNRNNYNPDIWGIHGWLFIDTSILSYPLNNPSDDIKKYYYNFLESLKYTLPCNDCRLHYNNYFNNNTLNNNILSSRDALIDWILKCHNNVNHINNKKMISKKDFIDYYNKLYKNKCVSKCNKKPFNIMNYINYIILFIFICLIIFYKK